ncbi:MAG TPA: hypothetical protein VJJ80_03850 [Patescibacteria group bacterium]|nr:hypothetical protein [Patescibacteria group bacterium]
MGQQKSIIISGEPETLHNKEQNISTESKIKDAKITKKFQKAENYEDKAKKVKPKKKKSRSQKYLESKKQLPARMVESPKEAIEMIRSISKANFPESLEAHFAMNFKKSDKKDFGKLKIDNLNIIHVKIGKTSESEDDLLASYNKIFQEIKSNRATAKKGVLKSIALCSTMSPSVKIKL